MTHSKPIEDSLWWAFFMLTFPYIFLISWPTCEGGMAMTNLERNAIQKLQHDGLGYKRIATTLGLPVNSVKTYCRRHPVEKNMQTAVCLMCGKELCHTPHKRKKKFCSDQCRMAWWTAHPELMQRKNLQDYICPCCGIRFSSHKKRRVYCSRACYAKARSKEAPPNG